MTSLERRHLLMLVEMRDRAAAQARLIGEQVEDYARELRDGGASTQSIADSLGVGKSTVQGWIRNADRRGAAGE